MAKLQTLFTETDVSSPLDKLVDPAGNFVCCQIKHTKDIIVDPANRGLVIGVTAGKALLGAVMMHAGYTNNPVELTDAGIVETFFGYWLIPPAVKIRDTIRSHMKAAASKITTPVKSKFERMVTAMPRVPHNRMLPAPGARCAKAH